MFRKIGAFMAAVTIWIVVATVGHRIMLGLWPDYVAALPTLAFSLPMMICRLLLSAMATLAAGAIAKTIDHGRWMPWAIGVFLLLFFIPQHYNIWHKLPVWYHLTFLGSLLPLTLLGGRIASVRFAVSPHQTRSAPELS